MSNVEILDDPVIAAKKTSELFNAIVILKSHVTTVTDPSGRFWVIDGMNPAMGTGGSGDVLAGIVGGLLAGGIDPARAACIGALIHDQIGKQARKDCGWFISQDLLRYVSRAFGRL